ncbi:hypothetical protein ACI2KO_03215 [Pseudomonas piscis]|uniref:hypothetical protein n=1 Tax=Pseudomonas piscis TaxID=2614538 RepID=UPI00384E01EE
MKTGNDGRSPASPLPDFSLTPQSVSDYFPAPVAPLQDHALSAKPDHFRHFLPGESRAKKSCPYVQKTLLDKLAVAADGKKASFLFGKKLPFVGFFGIFLRNNKYLTFFIMTIINVFILLF